MSNLCIHNDFNRLVVVALIFVLSMVTSGALWAASAAAESAHAEISSNQSGSTDDVSQNFSKNEKNTKNAENPVPAEGKSSGPADKSLFSNGLSLSDKKIQTRTDTTTSDRLRQMMAMIVVILILGGVFWLVSKKFMPRLRKGPAGFAGRGVKVLETTYIRPRQPVHLLQVGGKKLLIAGGKDGLKMLADVTDDFSSVLDEKQAEDGEGKI